MMTLEGCSGRGAGQAGQMSSKRVLPKVLRFSMDIGSDGRLKRRLTD